MPRQSADPATPELTALAGVPSWRAYLRGQLRSFVRGRVLELEDPRSLAAAPAGERWDSVLCLEVLETADDDAALFLAAAERVLPGGCLVAVAPAFPVLFCDRDRALGRRRRYSRRTLRALAPPGFEPLRARYLDSAGALAAVLTRLLRGARAPSPRAVRFWDRVLVPLSHGIDHWLLYAFGSTIYAAWRRPRDGAAR